MAKTEQYSYGAFISYRHVEPDRTWAKWLHGTLETFRTPKRLAAKGLPERVGRVFRDEDELPASAELKADIESALQASRFLIVVCSSRTPESRWVNQEVLRFRELGRHDRILALLVEGEPRTSFPAALCEIRQTSIDPEGRIQETVEEVEPLAADVRASRPESARHLKRMAKLRILACLLGCSFDDLRWREQERRQKRMARAAIALVLLVAVLAGLTVEALRQRSRAEEREQEAHRLFASHLRETGREAWLRGDIRRAYDDLTKAYAAGETGWSTRFLVARARERAEALVFESSAIGSVSPETRCIAVSPAGSFAAFATPGEETTEVRLVTLPEGRVLFKRNVKSADDAIDVGVSIDVARDGKRVAFVGSSFELWQPGAAEPVAALKARGHAVRFSPDGARVAVLGRRDVRVHDAETGALLATHALPRPGPAKLRWVDNRHVAVGHEDAGVSFFGESGNRVIRNAAGFATDGTGRLATWDKDGALEIRDVHGKQLAAGQVGADPVAALAPGGPLFAERGEGRSMRLYFDYPGDIVSRSIEPAVARWSDPLAFSVSGALLATTDPEGPFHIVGARSGLVLWEFPHRQRFRVAEAGFDEDERHLWIASFKAGFRLRADDGRTLRMWRLPPRWSDSSLPDHLAADIETQLVAHDPSHRTDHAPAPPTIQLKELDDGKTRITCAGKTWFAPGAIESAGASADGRYVATIARHGADDEPPELVVWNTATGRAESRTDDVGPYYEIFGFTPDGRSLLLRQMHTGNSGRYPLAGYDVATLAERFTFEPGAGEARLVFARDPERRRAVTTLETHRDIRVVTAMLDLATGEMRELADDAAADVAWHPSGRAVAALFGSEVRVWDAKTGDILLRDPAQKKQGTIEGESGDVGEDDPTQLPSYWIRFDRSGEWLAWRRDGQTTWRRITVETENPKAVRRRAEKLLKDSPDYP